MLTYTLPQDQNILKMVLPNESSSCLGMSVSLSFTLTVSAVEGNDFSVFGDLYFLSGLYLYNIYLLFFPCIYLQENLY